MKMCTYMMPGKVPCGNPAMNASTAGLCRIHVQVPRRAANIARARSEAELLPARRRALSQAALQKRTLLDFQDAPTLLTFQACEMALNNIIRCYEAETFDAERAELMLRCIRLASTTLRVHNLAIGPPLSAAELKAQSKAFNLLLREATEAVRVDRKLEKLQRMGVL